MPGLLSSLAWATGEEDDPAFSYHASMMTTIRIKNADLAQTTAIQKVVTKHGFGELDVRQGDLLATNPRNISVTEKGFVGSDLQKIGRHLSVSFQ